MEVGETSVCRKDPFQGTPNDYLKNQQIPRKTFKKIGKIFTFIEPCMSKLAIGIQRSLYSPKMKMKNKNKNKKNSEQIS